MARPKRANGSGAVYVKHGSYYGRWSTPAGRPNRWLGEVRRPGTSFGITRTHAERRLRELMSGVQVATDRDRTVSVVCQELLDQLEAKGRSKSHVETTESHLRVHIKPAMGEKPIDRVTEADVSKLLAALRRKELAPKTVRNIAGTLHSVFELALRRRWIGANPCSLVDTPSVPTSGEVRFLTQDELSQLLARGVPDDDWGRVERPLYLLAAMTGLRQGELLGLRWADLDADVRRVRVRQAFVRGEFKAPKSRRGVRGVPLARELDEALDALSAATVFDASDDLVFANPETGAPLSRSKLLKRFKKACRRAGVRVVRFHDLRHTFGTRVAASGEVSLRTLQEWMGHQSAQTTLIYADYQPGEKEADLISQAFGHKPPRAESTES